MYTHVKRILDFLLSLLALVVLSPLLLVLAVIIRATSPGPVFFRQKRVGQYKSHFMIYKVNFDSIIPHLTAERDSVARLRVNYIGVERLQRHPYLSFTQAKAIYELRRNKFYLKSIDDLRGLNCLTDEDIRRIEPYLSFEK